MFFDPATQTHRRLTVWKWYCGNVALLIMLGIAPVWIKTALHQYHNYDLGIFAQALHAIRPGNLNPFIPALNIRLFCDHFDPILILVSPLAKGLEPAYAALLVEHVLILLMPLPVVLACRRNRKTTPFVCFAITYLLFNRGIMSAIAFPVHPTTWASFFMVALGVCVNKQRWGWVLPASILLMACKEEFPFVILMIGIGLTCQKHFTIGMGLMALASFWMGVAFGIRPWLLDHTHGYASRVLSPLLHAPAITIWERLRNIGEAKRLLQSLLPLIPAAYWLLKQRSRPNWIMVIAAVPLLAIRFLDGAWTFHYLAPVAPLLLLAAWRPNVLSTLPWRYAALGIVIAALSASGPVSKAVAVYANINALNSDRLSSIAAARAHLLLNAHGGALVEGNLLPLLARRDNVFQIGGVQPNQAYRFFLAEKPPMGDPWPMSHSDIDRLITEWRSDATVRVLRDDAHIFFAEDAVGSSTKR
jgi:uncharacterized membrane protein